MSAGPLVSVVLPVCDGEAYLAEAIESVLAQDHRRLELIVVDDGSTDRSAAIAERYADDRVTLVRQANQGTGAARNAGLTAARGELIAHLDADDIWLESKLRLQVEAINADPCAGAARGLVEEFISPDLSEVERRGLRDPRGPLPGLVLQAMLIRRPAHELVGGFDPAWQAGQDLDWLLRARERGVRFAHVAEVVVRRRLHAANKGRRHPELATQRCRMIKRSLDRRRAAIGGRSEGATP
jgi:glycosyltransferase involved in cell wall biosynthesis